MKPLTKYQQRIVKQMQEGAAIMVNKRTGRVSIANTAQDVLCMPEMIFAKLIEYTHETIYYNYYGLTAAGKKLGI